MQTIFRTLEAATAADTAGSSIMMIGMILVMVAVFYFFLYRPQKKQEKETQEMRNSLEIGDVIYTSHSANSADTHTEGLTVVGILEESHSSFDNVVFTQLATLWHMHDHGEEPFDGHFNILFRLFLDNLLFFRIRFRPYEAFPHTLLRTDRKRARSDGCNMIRLELDALASRHDRHDALACDFKFESLLADGRVAQDYVALVAAAEREIHALNKRNLRPGVRALDYLQKKLHSLSLPSGWIFISWESSWNDSTGSS